MARNERSRDSFEFLTSFRLGRTGRLARRAGHLLRPLGMLSGYGIWNLAFRLLVLTFVTYFLSASSSRPPTFEEIGEVMGSNEVTLVGLCAIIFAMGLALLNPITRTTFAELFPVGRFRSGFVPGLAHGALLAAGVIAAFVVSGLYRYLGFYINLEEAPLALANILLRIVAIVALVYSEEFLFRDRLLRGIAARTESRDLGGAGTAVAITSILYCAVKALQFDLGVMHLLTLFLLSAAVSIRTLHDGDFTRGAGFLAGLLIVFHPLLSLPIFGNDFPGILIIKYQSPGEETTGFSVLRFLTGGSGGPISSFCFQLLLLLDIAKGLRAWQKKMIWNAPVTQIK